MPEAMTMRKMTFNLPEELIRRLKKLSTGKRSMLVKLAVEKELDREAAAANFKRIRRKTIWNKKHHPDLLTDEDFAHYRPMKTDF
jgi:metal-responsive CopG/Arc/MetJ family transcriptional regulator